MLGLLLWLVEELTLFVGGVVDVGLLLWLVEELTLVVLLLMWACYCGWWRA